MFTKNNASKSLIDAVSSILEKKPVVEEKTQPQVISEEQVSEVAPPGFEGTVKAMKKYKKIDNPFALAWSMKNKGYKSHKKADGSPKNEEVVEEEVEQIDEKVLETLRQTVHGSGEDKHVVKSTVHTHPDEEHYNTNTLIHKGTVNGKKFKVNHHINRGMEFQTKHSDAEKNAVKQHLISHKYAGKGTEIREEFEQIDELSKGTLGSYVKGAARDMAASRSLAKDFERDAKSAKKPNTKDINTRLSNKFNKNASKRNAGIGKAVERLTKEDAEQVDETLKGNQHKIDKNKNNKIDAQDFKILRKEDIESFDEALKGNQHEIDKNHNKKIDAQDFRILRAKMKKEEVETVEEGWDDMVKAAKEKVSSGPKPSGGSGVKQGTRYGGSKQKDEPEEKKKN